jgi:hypothetical protein
MAKKMPSWARHGLRWPGLEGYGGGILLSPGRCFSFVRCAGVKGAET